LQFLDLIYYKDLYKQLKQIICCYLEINSYTFLIINYCMSRFTIAKILILLVIFKILNFTLIFINTIWNLILEILTKMNYILHTKIFDKKILEWNQIVEHKFNFFYLELLLDLTYFQFFICKLFVQNFFLKFLIVEVISSSTRTMKNIGGWKMHLLEVGTKGYFVISMSIIQNMNYEMLWD